LFDFKRINFPILLLSFALAVLLWMHVKTPPDGSIAGTFSFSVELRSRNMPAGYVVVGNLPSRVTFTAFGKPEEQRKINPSNLSAFVDLSEQPKDGRYLVRLESTNDYNVQWQPTNLRIPILLEKQVSRSIPIEVEPVGNFKLENYRYDGATSDPNTVTITGAQSIVERVRRARAYLSLTAVEIDSEQRARVELLDEKNSPVDNVTLSTDSVSVRAIIAPRPPKRSLLIQPVWSGSPEFGATVSNYEFDPAQVSVEGPADVLANMSVINTKPINISGLTQTTTLPIELDLPVGIRLTKPEVVTVKVTLKRPLQEPVKSGGP